jgi:hypothetical protein
MRYLIEVSGPYDERAEELLAGFDLRTIGETRVLCADLDQAALHGLLERIRVLRLQLVEVRRVRPATTTPGADSRPGGVRPSGPVGQG